MKIKYSFYLAVCSFALIYMLSGCGATNTAIVTVNFGVPPKGGGPCGGKGVCSAVASSAANNASGVPVTLITNSMDKNLLIMTFSMDDLKQKQPDQVQYFTDGGSYDFDAPCDLTGMLYAPLKLQPGAHIDKTCKSKVSIKGDAVVVTYTYAHQ